MVAGQARDLDAESRDVNDDNVERIHHEKTGALICASGAAEQLSRGANEAELEAITNMRINLGLLFQITDDLLDVTATADDLERLPAKMRARAKRLFPRFMVSRSRAKPRLPSTRTNMRCARSGLINKPHRDLWRSIARSSYRQTEIAKSNSYAA